MGRRGKHRKFGAARRRRISGGRIHFARGLKKKGPTPGVSPVGRYDHAMDEIRYFAATVAAKEENGWFAGSVERKAF